MLVPGKLANIRSSATAKTAKYKYWGELTVSPSCAGGVDEFSIYRDDDRLPECAAGIGAEKPASVGDVAEKGDLVLDLGFAAGHDAAENDGGAILDGEGGMLKPDDFEDWHEDAVGGDQDRCTTVGRASDDGVAIVDESFKLDHFGFEGKLDEPSVGANGRFDFKGDSHVACFKCRGVCGGDGE